jgi:hypothetical protein
MYRWKSPESRLCTEWIQTLGHDNPRGLPEKITIHTRSVNQFDSQFDAHSSVKWTHMTCLFQETLGRN